jgi:hypothetical protein
MANSMARGILEALVDILSSLKINYFSISEPTVSKPAVGFTRNCWWRFPVRSLAHLLF